MLARLADPGLADPGLADLGWLTLGWLTLGWLTLGWLRSSTWPRACSRAVIFSSGGIVPSPMSSIRRANA